MGHITLLEAVLAVFGVCGAVSLFTATVLSMRLTSRMADFIMAERDAAAHKVATSPRMPFDPERDRKAQEEKRLVDDYNDALMRGVATDEDIERFGLAEGIIQ